MNGPTSWEVFLHFPIMIILANLVFSACRYDDWRLIARKSLEGIVYIITFLGGVFLFLYLGLQVIIPWLFG
jgi:membrane-anchored protein YejM (alkaline phosphatase superfamily)